MAWIKRNLFFVIGGVLALAALGYAGYYNYKSWSHNQAAFNRLNEIYGQLREYTGKKPSPGNDKINNIAAAREQEHTIREWIRQAVDSFLPIPPIPDTDTNAVSSEAFAAALRRTVDQLQREAEATSVALPPSYNFSFEAQRKQLRFSPGSLGALAAQLGDVKTIAEVFFAAKVNSLDGIQRVRVSEDDATGPQADYFDGRPVTNNLAVMTPYQMTFRSFTPEIAQVLADFASSPHEFIVKSINVQPAGAMGAAAPGTPETMEPMPGRPMPFAPPAQHGPPVATGRGGLQTVLNEQLLRVTLVVDVVELLPKK